MTDHWYDEGGFLPPQLPLVATLAPEECVVFPVAGHWLCGRPSHPGCRGNWIPYWGGGSEGDD